jgi:hypothetical protein
MKIAVIGRIKDTYFVRRRLLYRLAIKMYYIVWR